MVSLLRWECTDMDREVSVVVLVSKGRRMLRKVSLIFFKSWKLGHAWGVSSGGGGDGGGDCSLLCYNDDDAEILYSYPQKVTEHLGPETMAK